VTTIALFYLSSGLFLGWSLGANDAANVFGTAVGSRMLRFRTAAMVCSVFVILGAISGGAGVSATLNRLGGVNAIGGAFMVALAAALAVYLLLRTLKLPVSTSQAIVGALVGWNSFAGRSTDLTILTSIVASWIVAPLLSAILGATLFLLVRTILRRTRMHLLELDILTRGGLLVVGAFGAYSLGQNNIANVMGVFLPVSPFGDLYLGPFFVTRGDILLLLGGLAIAVGVFTYSRRVMDRVGGAITRLSPVAALVVVLAVAIVLFIFASKDLQSWLQAHNLPSLPLVPVSSSQAVIGAILGIAIVRRSGIRWVVVRDVTIGWIAAPLLAGLFAFIGLFILQNVFTIEVVGQ
jgi:PiT family inorganic phosphate transporter